MAFLDQAGDDWTIACAVVKKAQSLQHEYRHDELRAVIDALGKSVGGRVAQQMARMFR